jgi:hypothetical protein
MNELVRRKEGAVVKDMDLSGTGRELSRVAVFALAVIGVIGAVLAGGFILLMLFFGSIGGQWG